MDRQTDVDGLSLIDVSAEDDSLLSSPALKLQNDADRTLDFHSSPATTIRVPQSALASTHHRISSSESTKGARAKEKHSALHDGLNCGADKQNNGTSSAMEGEQPQLSKEAVQPTRKRRAGQCNLRKSLAWDKAFFTSEGVLNPEELSLVNKTFKKSNETLLPVIEEEESIRSSLGSNCSLGEDDSALQCLEEKLFTELQTSKPKLDNGVDKIYNAASCETCPAQPLGLPQSISKAKPIATEKRHNAIKVVETPLQKKAALGSHTSFTSKRSSVKAMEEPQKASQSNDAYGKNCSAAPSVVTNNLSKGHKRMKYTHGNAVPANLSRASYHRNSPAKIKENFGIASRSFTSPNSSASDNLNSEKGPASSSCTLEKLRKSLFEMPKKVAPGTPDSDTNGNVLGTSCVQFLHGMPAFHSSMVSAALTGSSSLFQTHTSREQFAPTTGAGTSADSTVSQCSKNRKFGNAMGVHLPTKGDSISIACNSMIFNAKDPPNNSGKALPVTFTSNSSRKDNSINIASNSMIFSAKDPTNNSGNALPVTLAAKPSGLRMPSPKLGFFDSTKVIRAPYSSAIHRRSAGNRVLPPKPNPRGPSSIHQGSRLKPPGVPCAIPSSVSVSNLNFPDYNAIVPSSAPMTSNWMSDTSLKSSSTSLSSPPFQPQVKPDSEASGLALLAQKKFGVSKAQQSLSVERSDQKQVPSDICNGAKAIIAEDIERKKTTLHSNFCQVNEYNCSVMTGESQTQLRFSQGRSSLQDIQQVDSEAITATTIGTGTSPDTEPGKISNMNVVSDILVNRHFPKGSYGKTAEENQIQLSYSQGKFSLEDIPQVGSEAITATGIDTETSKAAEAGKISNMTVSDILVNLHSPKGSYGKMAEQNQTRLRFSQGKLSLQDIPQLGSEAVTSTTIDTETSPATEAGKFSKTNVVSDILVNLHIPKGSYDKMAEESQTGLSFMRGKSTLQDICQTGPEAIWTDSNSTDTSPTMAIGKASNANNDNIPQAGHCYRMADLSVAMTNYLSEPLQSEQLPPPPCSKTAKVSEKFQLETCTDLIRNEEYDGLLNGDSDGTMRDDKVKNGVSFLGSSLQQENKLKLVSWPVTLEHFPTPRQNSDLCYSLQENEIESVSQPVTSAEHLPSPCGKEIEKVSIGLDIAAATGPVSVHIEKQDAASCPVSQRSITTQDEALPDNVRTGNSNLVCQLQLENVIEAASQLVTFEQSLPTREVKIEKVTEEFPISETSSLEKGLDLVQNKGHDRACTKVFQGSMNMQSDNLCDNVKSILSDVTSTLEFKTEMKFNPEENDFPANGSNSSNNNQDSTTDTLSTPSLLSGCPSHEAASSVIEHKSEDKDDSSSLNVKLSHKSVTPEAQMKSEFKGVGKEVKFNGRSPLAANYKLLNSTAQEISQKYIKEESCSMAGTGTGRLASLPMTFPVSDDTADKENSRPEEQDGVGMLELQGADGHSHMNSGRKSMGNLSVQVQKITSPLDASPFSEEWIAAIQAVGEEWLQMKRGPVQNSPPNKIVPQPGPWSPVRRHNQQLGPFDCTKYTNPLENSDVYEDE